MKKIISIYLAILLVFTGCTTQKEVSSEKKYTIDQFIEAYKVYAEKNDKKNYDISEFEEITSKQIFEETGAQIFKNYYDYETYLMWEDEIYVLGTGFGGMGVNNIVTSDFDKDGVKELLYTYSFGSGLHRSSIGCFDLYTKKNVPIDIITDNLTFVSSEVYLEKKSDTKFTIFLADLISPDANKYKFKKKGAIGNIESVNKKPTATIKIKHIEVDEKIELELETGQ